MKRDPTFVVRGHKRFHLTPDFFVSALGREKLLALGRLQFDRSLIESVDFLPALGCHVALISR
jgi:hypothetical protein